MTPDLDQTLSLKASLEDKVTPALNKIKQGVRDTRAALNELAQSANNTEQGLNRSAEGMAHKTTQSVNRLEGDLKKAGAAFNELGDDATKNSEKVGRALQDALYTRDSAAKLRELDTGLKGLKSSLEGMASTTRPMNAKARKLQVIGQDTLNRKVIPAFQELHGTLDDFPDVLQEITTLENRRMEGMQSFGGVLGGVNERVAGFGDAVKGVQFGIQDFVGAITSGFFAIQGLKLRDFQIGAGRTAGAASYAQAEDSAALVNLATRAPMEVWQDAYTTLLDISKVSEETYPKLLRDMVNLSKVTGLATEEFASLYTQMSEIGQLRGEKWVELSQKISYFATNSRASIEELADVLKQAALDMTRFSRESRAAYANAALANAAASADIGVGAGKAGEIYQNILDNPEVAARLQGLVGSGGVNVFAAAMDPKQHQRLMAQVYEGAARQATNFQADTYMGRQAFNQVYAGTGIDADTALRVRNFMQEHGLTAPGAYESFVNQQYAVPASEQSAEFRKLQEIIRGSAPEQFEQVKSFAQAAGFEVGQHQMKALESFMGPGLDWAEKTALTLYDLNQASQEFFTKALAYFGLGQNVMTLLTQTLGRIPIIGGLMNALGLNTVIGSLVGAGAAAYGISRVVDPKKPKEKSPFLSTDIDSMEAELSRIRDMQQRKVDAEKKWRDERIKEGKDPNVKWGDGGRSSKEIRDFDRWVNKEYEITSSDKRQKQLEKSVEATKQRRQEFKDLYAQIDVGFREQIRRYDEEYKAARTDKEKKRIEEAATRYLDQNMQRVRTFEDNKAEQLELIRQQKRQLWIPPKVRQAQWMAETFGPPLVTGAKIAVGEEVKNTKAGLSAIEFIADKAARVAGEYLNMKYGDEIWAIKKAAPMLLEGAVDYVAGPGYWDQITNKRKKLSQAEREIQASDAPGTSKQQRLERVMDEGLPVIDPNGALINAAALNMGAQSFDEMISRTNREQVTLQTKMVELLGKIAGGGEQTGPSAADIIFDPVETGIRILTGDYDTDRALGGG